MRTWPHFIKLSKSSLEGPTTDYFLFRSFLFPFLSHLFSFCFCFSLVCYLQGALAPSAPLLVWNGLEHRRHFLRFKASTAVSSPSLPCALRQEQDPGVPMQYFKRLFFLKSNYWWLSSSSGFLPASSRAQAAHFLRGHWWPDGCKSTVFLHFREGCLWPMATAGEETLSTSEDLIFKNFPDLLPLKTFMIMINHHENLLSIYYMWPSVLLCLQSFWIY